MPRPTLVLVGGARGVAACGKLAELAGALTVTVQCFNASGNPFA